MKKNWQEIKNIIQHHESDMDINYEWLRLEQKLEKNKRRRILLFLLPIGVLSLILLCYYFIKPHDPINNDQYKYAFDNYTNTNSGHQNSENIANNIIDKNKIIIASENKSENIRLNNNKNNLETKMPSIYLNANANNDQNKLINSLIKNEPTISSAEPTEMNDHSTKQYIPSESGIEATLNDPVSKLLALPFIQQLTLRPVAYKHEIENPRPINYIATIKPIEVVKRNNIWITGLFNIGLTVPSYQTSPAENLQALSLRKKYIRPLENISTSIHVNQHIYNGYFAGFGFQYLKFNEKLDYTRMDTSVLNIPNQVLESYITHEGVTTVLTGQSQAYTIFKTQAIRFNEIHTYSANVVVGKEFSWLRHSFIIHGGLSIPVAHQLVGYSFKDAHELIPLENIIQTKIGFHSSLGFHYQSSLTPHLHVMIGLLYNNYNIKTNQGYDITNKNYSTSIGLKYIIKK